MPDDGLRDPVPAKGSLRLGGLGGGRVLEALLQTRHRPEEGHRIAPFIRSLGTCSLVVLQRLHRAARQGDLQSLSEAVVQNSRGCHSGDVPRVRLSSRVPDGGHPDRGMAPKTRPRPRVPWRCPTCSRGSHQGAALAIRRVLDPVVSVNRPQAQSTHRFRVACAGCRDGGLFGAETQAATGAEKAGVVGSAQRRRAAGPGFLPGWRRPARRRPSPSRRDDFNGSDRLGRCDGGTPAGSARRQFLRRVASPTSPTYLSLYVGEACCVEIWLIWKDMAVSGV